MAGVLLTFAWRLPIVLLVGTLPALWVALSATVEFHRWRKRNTINEPRLHYYHRALIHDEAAPESVSLTLAIIFHRRTARCASVSGERLHLARKQTFGQIAARTAGLLTMSGGLDVDCLAGVAGPVQSG